MIIQIAKDYSSKFAVFSIGSSSDVANLPTMNSNGKGDGEQFTPVCPGSIAKLNDGTGSRYVLHDNNTWTLEG